MRAPTSTLEASAPQGAHRAPPSSGAQAPDARRPSAQRRLRRRRPRTDAPTQTHARTRARVCVFYQEETARRGRRPEASAPQGAHRAPPSSGAQAPDARRPSAQRRLRRRRPRTDAPTQTHARTRARVCVFYQEETARRGRRPKAPVGRLYGARCPSWGVVPGFCPESGESPPHPRLLSGIHALSTFPKSCPGATKARGRAAPHP